MTPQQFHELHREAMRFSFKASEAQVNKDFISFRELMTHAYEKEKEAALFLKDRFDVEPTRSILFRSAASMAMDLELFREAEQLIAWGLTGNPPPYEAEVLREVYEEIMFNIKTKIHTNATETNIGNHVSPSQNGSLTQVTGTFTQADGKKNVITVNGSEPDSSEIKEYKIFVREALQEIVKSNFSDHVTVTLRKTARNQFHLIAIDPA